MMIAALGTLPFLATIWLVVVLGASLLEESGAKIAAALRGASASHSNEAVAPTRLRPRFAVGRPMPAEPRWRAAA
jgi:hypothetical protein